MDRRSAVRSPRKQGWPAPFVELRVTRPGPDGKDVEAPRDGETPANSSPRTLGRCQLLQFSDQAHRWTADGWFKTGDVSTIDDEASSKLSTAPKSRKIRRRMDQLRRPRNTLMGHPAVKEAAV